MIGYGETHTHDDPQRGRSATDSKKKDRDSREITDEKSTRLSRDKSPASAESGGGEDSGPKGSNGQYDDKLPDTSEFMVGTNKYVNLQIFQLTRQIFSG